MGCALLISACGSGVTDLSASSGPLLTVHARLDPAALATATGAPLRASVVWAAVPGLDIVCLRYAAKSPKLAAACPDPLRLRPGSIEPVFPAPNADGLSFDIPLSRLPATSVSVGTVTGRIAWGSVLVGEDLDGDGQAVFSGRWRRNQVQGSGGGGMGGSGAAGNPDGATDGATDTGITVLPPKDGLLAASFITLLEPQQRLGFREGDFDAGSLFYPAPGCPQPPKGFSVVRASAYPILPGSLPGPCQVDDPATGVVKAAPVGAAQVRDLACNTPPGRVQNPNQADHNGPGGMGRPAPIPKGTAECLSPELALYVGDGNCPSVTLYALKGCSEDPECKKPDWDVVKTPPDWWPCTGATP